MNPLPLSSHSTLYTPHSSQQRQGGNYKLVLEGENGQVVGPVNSSLTYTRVEHFLHPDLPATADAPTPATTRLESTDKADVLLDGEDRKRYLQSRRLLINGLQSNDPTLKSQAMLALKQLNQNTVANAVPLVVNEVLLHPDLFPADPVDDNKQQRLLEEQRGVLFAQSRLKSTVNQLNPLVPPLLHLEAFAPKTQEPLGAPSNTPSPAANASTSAPTVAPSEAPTPREAATAEPPATATTPTTAPTPAPLDTTPPPPPMPVKAPPPQPLSIKVVPAPPPEFSALA
jgi:hypothetical protein